MLVAKKVFEILALSETSEDVFWKFFDLFVVDDDPADRRVSGTADGVDAEEGAVFGLASTRLADRLFVCLEADQRAATKLQRSNEVIQ